MMDAVKIFAIQPRPEPKYVRGCHWLSIAAEFFRRDATLNSIPVEGEGRAFCRADGDYSSPYMPVGVSPPSEIPTAGKSLPVP